MTDRERLIELLITPIKLTNGIVTVHEIKVSLYEAGFVADHLLANGVIVPPCKVGDKVYVFEDCSCYSDYYAKACGNRLPGDKRRKAISIVPVGIGKRKHHCIKLFERKFKLQHLDKIGKTVFLTKEEAEKALKERADNG